MTQVRETLKPISHFVSTGDFGQRFIGISANVIDGPTIGLNRWVMLWFEHEFRDIAGNLHTGSDSFVSLYSKLTEFDPIYDLVRNGKELRVVIDYDTGDTKVTMWRVESQTPVNQTLIRFGVQPNLTSLVRPNARVDRAKSLLAQGATYPRGCSEFVCAVLEIDYELANDLIGDDPVSIGDNNNYTGVSPGDVCGWRSSSGSGHVTIYVGETDTKFIDVREPGQSPRRIVRGYGDNREVFKSKRF